MVKKKISPQNSINTIIPNVFKAGAVDKLTFALKKFGDQQIHAIIFFDGHFDEERIKTAARLLLDTEPVLGCRFIDHHKTPYWERRNDLDSLPYCTFTKTLDFNRDLFDFIVTPCDPREDLGIQLKIFHQEKNDVLVVKTSHAIIDGGGIIEYLFALGDLYNKLAVNPNLRIEPNVTGSRSLKQVLKRFNIFQKLFIFLRNRSSKPNWMLPYIGLEAKNPNYILRRFTEEQFRKIKKISKKHNATINDMILTAFYRSIFKIINPNTKTRLLSVVTINLRAYLPNQKGESICNLSSSSYPKINYKPNEQFEETLFRVRDEMNFRKRFAPGIGPGFFIENVFKFPFARVKKSIQKRYDKDLKRNATHPVFTNVGLLRTEDLDFGEIKAIDAYLMTPIMNAPGFIFGVMTFNERMSICMGFYESSYNKELIQTFIDNIVEELNF